MRDGNLLRFVGFSVAVLLGAGLYEAHARAFTREKSSDSETDR
jgi:hypothetical protein